MHVAAWRGMKSLEGDRARQPWGMMALGLALLMVCACAPSEPSIRVEGAWVRPTLDRAAAYMTIFNDGGADDALVGAKTEAAASVSLHRTVQQGEMMGMEPVPRLETPAGDSVELKPLGLHLMLMDTKETLEPGQKLRIILEFETSGEIAVEAEVRRQ